MLFRGIVVIVAGLGTVGDVSSIRQQETLLANALRTAEKSTLLSSTDPQLRVKFQCNSDDRVFHTDMSREDRIAAVTQAKAVKYDTRVGEIRLIPGSHTLELATANIVETIDHTERYIGETPVCRGSVDEAR